MPQLNKYLITFGIAVLFLSISFFAIIRFVINPAAIENKLLTRLQQVSGGEVSYDTFTFGIVPKIKARLNNLAMHLPGSYDVAMQANKMEFQLHPLKALFGRTGVTVIRVDDAILVLKFRDDFFLEELALHDLNLKLSDIRFGEPIQIELDANVEDSEGFLKGSGWVTLSPENPWDWSAATFEGTLELDRIRATTFSESFRQNHNFTIKNGFLGGTVTLNKVGGEDALGVQADLNVNEFVYETSEDSQIFQSPTIGAGLSFKLGWNPETEQLKLERSVFDSPLGVFSGNGDFYFGTGEVKNARLTASELVMESLPHYLTSLGEALPFNLGFSGQSHLDMSIEGTVDHLSLHAKWDLTSALLTYGRYFSKPKDLASQVSFEGLLKEGKTLSSDFTLKLKSASIKGTIQGLDLETGEGKLNIISNKFDLLGWHELIPILEGYDIGGEMKLLINAEGNLGRFKEWRPILNVNLDQGWISRGEHGLRNISFAFDYGSVALDIKKASFQIEDSIFGGDLKVFNLLNHPDLHLKLEAEELEPTAFFQTVKALGEPWFSDRWKLIAEKIEKPFVYVFPDEEVIRNLNTEIDYKDRQWTMEKFSFDAYEGNFKAKASVDASTEIPTYWADVEVDRLSLAQFTSRGGRVEKVMDGNFFLQAGFTGDGFNPQEWQKRLKGNGKMKTTNGEFYTFDVLGNIAKIAEFEDVGLLISETTPFDDLQASFDLNDGKLLTHNLAIAAADFNADARGEIHMDGTLNSRMDVFLSPTLTKQVVEPLIGKPFDGTNEQFGPIPLLLAGPLGNPQMKPDSMSLSKLLADLERRKNQRSLRNFLPENRLFAR